MTCSLRSTTFVRGLAIAVSLAAGLARVAAADPPPTSWEYPLLPHVQALAIWPSPVMDGGIASVTLSATYASECWSVVDAGTVDATHVRVTLEPCTAPPESLSGWVRTLVLGQVFTGIQPLTVTATLLNPAGPPTVEERTIGYEVVPFSPPPPPPPVDSTTTLVLGIGITPSPITLSDPVTIHVNGRMPFGCPLPSGDVVIGDPVIALAYAPGGCGDSAHAWQQDIALGTLAKGAHSYVLDVAAIVAPDTLHERYTVQFDVIDPNDPPPPPPVPVDSLHTVLSSSHPNPFRIETRFSVSLAAPQPAQVAVYDLGGRRIAQMYDGELPAGTSWLTWNGRRSDGTRAPGGIYFYRLTLPNRVITRRLVLLGTP